MLLLYRYINIIYGMDSARISKLVLAVGNAAGHVEVRVTLLGAGPIIMIRAAVSDLQPNGAASYS